MGHSATSNDRLASELRSRRWMPPLSWAVRIPVWTKVGASGAATRTNQVSPLLASISRARSVDNKVHGTVPRSRIEGAADPEVPIPTVQARHSMTGRDHEVTPRTRRWRERDASSPRLMGSGERLKDRDVEVVGEDRVVQESEPQVDDQLGVHLGAVRPLERSDQRRPRRERPGLQRDAWPRASMG